MGRTKKPCYYCGASSSSSEHAPPKQTFKGFSVDSITVPSCDEHNTDKSGDDDAVVKWMLTAIWENRDKFKLHPHVYKVLRLVEPHFERVKKKVQPFPWLSDPPSGFEPTATHLHGSVRMPAWMQKVTAALVYDGIGYYDPSIKWSEAGVFSPEWFEGDATSKRSMELFSPALNQQRLGEDFERDAWQPGWMSGPRGYPNELYNFRLAFRSDDKMITFRHQFFGSSRWFVLFYATEPTFKALLARVRCG